MNPIRKPTGDDLIRAILNNFSDTKFHVRRYDHARATSYVISWTDGPSEDAFQALALPCIRGGVPLGLIDCSRDAESCRERLFGVSVREP